VLRGLLRNRFALLLLLLAAWGSAPAGLMPAVVLAPVVATNGPLEEEKPSGERSDPTDEAGKLSAPDRSRAHRSAPSVRPPARSNRLSTVTQTGSSQPVPFHPAAALRNGLGTFYRC
jgi:hypothetical protein